MPFGVPARPDLPPGALPQLRLRDAGPDSLDTLAVAVVRRAQIQISLRECAEAMEIEGQIEEVLERLWTLREQGRTASAGLEGEKFDFDPSPALAAAAAQGWVSLGGPTVEMTPAGELCAAGVIRRHRLAERLLYDVIRVDNSAMEAVACELEHSHILSEEATDRVCAFLGHPPTCPHGRPIPRGECCARFGSEVRPLVGPLSAGNIGGDYRIVFIATRSHRRLDRLCALGVMPGATLRLLQRLPAFVVQIGGTEIALDSEIASDIFVLPC